MLEETPFGLSTGFVRTSLSMDSVQFVLES